MGAAASAACPRSATSRDRIGRSRLAAAQAALRDARHGGGGIRIAESGKLSEPIPSRQLKDELLQRISRQGAGFIIDRRGEGARA